MEIDAVTLHREESFICIYVYIDKSGRFECGNRRQVPYQENGLMLVAAIKMQGEKAVWRSMVGEEEWEKTVKQKQREIPKLWRSQKNLNGMQA